MPSRPVVADLDEPQTYVRRHACDIGIGHGPVLKVGDHHYLVAGHRSSGATGSSLAERGAGPIGADLDDRIRAPLEGDGFLALPGGRRSCSSSYR